MVDEEEAAYYQEFELVDPPRPPSLGSPSQRRGVSEPESNRNFDFDSSHRRYRIFGSSHRRGLSQPEFYFRDDGIDISDTPSVYMTAGDRRRMAHPEIYCHDTPEHRSSVLRAIFTPMVSEVEDMEKTHSFLYVMLHPRSETWHAEIFKKFISTLIIGDLIAFVISTEQPFYDKYWLWFQVMEGTTASIFLVEYIARVYVVIENEKFAIYGPLWGRLRWMCTFHAVIDVLATAPFFIYLLTGWDMPKLTYLRIFRVLRIMKTDSYARAFNACYRVVYFNREILWVAVLICLFLIVSSSVLLYYCRPRSGDDELEFQSIPSTLYLSVLILTGQDSFIRSSVNMPWYTKLIVGLTGALSVAMYAIPVSLLTWGFEAEAERCARKTRAVIKQGRSMANSTIDKVDSLNSDEEYLRIIAKDTSRSSVFHDEQKADRIKRMTDLYMKDDQDGRKFSALTTFLGKGSHNGEPSPSIDLVDDGVVMAGEISNLRSRIGNLESTVTAMNAKLDRLCALLETRKD